MRLLLLIASGAAMSKEACQFVSVAAEKGQLEQLKEFVAAGCDINHGDQAGRSGSVQQSDLVLNELVSEPIV